MNPRKKVHSSGVFSWEDNKAGMRKPLHNHHHHHCSNTTVGSVEAVPRKSRSTISSPPKTTEYVLDESSSNRTPATHQEEMKIIPLPPCRRSQPPPPPRRSTFWKAFGIRRRQHDPFLVAYKECTKTPTSHNTIRAVGFNSMASKAKVSFSCKTSIDARDDHFLKPSSTANT